MSIMIAQDYRGGPIPRAPRKQSKRCETCGHVATRHNDLGYCQAPGKRGADGCHCEHFLDTEREEEARAWKARKAES